MSRQTWLGAGIGVAGGVAVAGAAVWYLALRDVAQPARVREAVTSFSEHPGGRTSTPVGVYVYATHGFEKIDALTGAAHRYPSRSSITVTGDACGVRMRWDVLRGRSTTWSFCIGQAGWSLVSQDERHTFFGHTDTRSYACPRFVFWAGRVASSLYTCAAADATEHGEEAFVGRSLLAVGKARVATVHLRRTAVYRGATRGTASYDFWLDRSTGVPVRLVMVSRTTNDSPVGAVHYEERVALRLTSLTPRR
jgi:hypothetical protein